MSANQNELVNMRAAARELDRRNSPEEWRLYQITIGAKYGLPAVWECERRLRENGFIPHERHGPFADGAHSVIFRVPPSFRPEDLDFLRPDFLPPPPPPARHDGDQIHRRRGI